MSGAPPARRSWPLRPEQLAIIVGIAGAILMGIGWGLPSKPWMALLLEGGAPTPRQVELLNSLHTLRAQGGIAPDSLPARGAFARPDWYASPAPGPWLTFSEAERLYALRSYILSTGAVDEDYTMVAIGNMNPRRLDFDPDRYIYGGSYLYPVGLMLFVMESTGLLHVTRDFSYYLRHPGQIARIYVAGRLLNLLALVGTLIVLALLGRLLDSDTAGTLAMLAYALSTLIIDYTATMKPHVFTAFWVALAVYLLVQHVQRGTGRALVLSVLAAGVAAGSSAPAAAVGLLYPFLLFEPGRAGQAVRKTLAAWAGIVIVFLLTNPYVLFNFAAYRATVATVSSESGTELAVFGLHKLRWYLHGAFVRSYPFPVVLVGLLFMLWYGLRGSGPLRRLALATLGLLLLFGSTSPMVRISAFAGTLFCLFAGVAVRRWIFGPLSGQPLLRAGLVVLLFLPGAANAALLLRDIVSDRVWYEPTLRWVRSARIGPGATIGVFVPPNPADLPPFPFLHARLIDMNSAAAAADPPEYVVIGTYFADVRARWTTHPLRSRYRLLFDLGHRPSYDWLSVEKRLDEARTGGYVYQLVRRSPAGTRPGARGRPRPATAGQGGERTPGVRDSVGEPLGSLR